MPPSPKQAFLIWNRLQEIADLLWTSYDVEFAKYAHEDYLEALHIDQDMDHLLDLDHDDDIPY